MEFLLRPISIADLNALVEYANNPKIAANMTDRFPHPYTHEAGKKFIENATKNDPATIMAIEIDGNHRFAPYESPCNYSDCICIQRCISAKRAW